RGVDGHHASPSAYVVGAGETGRQRVDVRLHQGFDVLAGGEREVAEVGPDRAAAEVGPVDGDRAVLVPGDAAGDVGRGRVPVLGDLREGVAHVEPLRAVRPEVVGDVSHRCPREELPATTV